MAKKKGKKGKKARKAEKKAARQARKAAQSARAKRAAPKPKVAKTARKAARKPKPAKATKPVPKARRQPESLRLRSVAPSFTVSDIHESTAYYRDVLGFQVGEHWEEDGRLKGVELVAGSVRIWLGQDDWKKGRDRVKGEGFRLYCATAQDIDVLAERVRAAGGVLAEEPKDQAWAGATSPSATRTAS